MRLQTSFGLSSSGSLLVPYLSLRPRPVYVNHSKSLPTILQFRVFQGSVLGPNTLILYTQMKLQISDDTQLYATAHLSELFEMISSSQIVFLRSRFGCIAANCSQTRSKKEMIHTTPKRTITRKIMPSFIWLNDCEMSLSASFQNLGV